MATSIHDDFVVVFWHCLTCDARKATEANLGRADRPYGVAACTAGTAKFRLERTLQVLGKFDGVGAWVGSRVLLYIFGYGDGCKAVR